jgi:hypothetical protein
MQDKILTANGTKDWQRSDPTVNREYPYRNWLRTWGAFSTDVDMLMFKRGKDLEIYPYALTDLTMGDLLFEDVCDNYLKAITDRYFSRDGQGAMMGKLCEMLNIRGYLVLFTKEMTGFWVLSFANREWHKFTCEGWKQNLKKLEMIS